MPLTVCAPVLACLQAEAFDAAEENPTDLEDLLYMARNISYTVRSRPNFGTGPGFEWCGTLISCMERAALVLLSAFAFAATPSCVALRGSQAGVCVTISG